MKQTLNVCNLLLLAVNVKMAGYGSEFNRSTLKTKKPYVSYQAIFDFNQYYSTAKKCLNFHFLNVRFLRQSSRSATTTLMTVSHSSNPPVSLLGEPEFQALIRRIFIGLRFGFVSYKHRVI
jgi:hypothetical protein